MLNVYYLAYGSNLHPLRLQARAPSARASAVVPMPGQRLTFHKRSKDLSGKCNLLQDKSSQAYGVLYEMSPEDMQKLNKHEGPGYIQLQTKVELQGQVYFAITYIAQRDSIAEGLSPYHWYKELVATGAEYYGFPNPYIANIRTTPSLTDHDGARVQAYQALLQTMLQHPTLNPALPRSTNVTLAANQ